VVVDPVLSGMADEGVLDADVVKTVGEGVAIGIVVDIIVGMMVENAVVQTEVNFRLITWSFFLLQ
jgi:hypothetical protein